MIANKGISGLCGCCLALLLVASPARGVLVQLDVDETADLVDEVPGDGSCETYFTTCSLRAAIQESNALGTIDRINVPAGVYKLQLPGAGEDDALTGDLDIKSDVEIVGAGPGQTIIGGNGLDRVFEIHDMVIATIRGMTIRGGFAGDSSPFGSSGGGIRIGASFVNLEEIEVTGNVADAAGGLHAGSGSTVSVVNSSFRSNKALSLGFVNSHGGGIFSKGGLDLDRVEISDNDSALQTAGLYGDSGTFSVVNSTISGNRGRGLSTYNTELELVNSSIYDNAADGLVYNSNSGSETLTVRNSIIAGHNFGADCVFFGTLPTTMSFEGEYNLDSDGSCPLDDVPPTVDLPSTDPQLGPLGLHGGHTRTHVPLVGSLVIDAGNNAHCVTPDQRGALRPLDVEGLGAVCDIGAVEVLPCDGPFDDHEVLDPYVSSAANLFVACFTITNGGDFQVRDGGLASWMARDAFTFQNGFEVHTGGTFEAVLDADADSTTTLP